jgi:YVTN family beta-propeller protein
MNRRTSLSSLEANWSVVAPAGWPRVGALALWLVALAVLLVPAGARAAGTVYAGEQNLNLVAQYAIGAGGLLSPLTPASVAAGREPLGVAVTPDGRSVYVTNVNDSTVSQYDVDPVSGALSPKTPATVASRLFPNGVAVTPDGKSVYVTNFDFAVSQYDVDPVSGALSPKTPARVAAGPNPAFVAVTPDGRSAYASNFFAGTFGGSVSQYSIDPVTGALSPKTPASVATGALPFRIAVTPDGNSAYVTNGRDNTVSQYTIDPLTGALSPKTPATVATGSGPTGIAVTPPPRVPTSKDQCKNGGWRNFPQFKNQGQCVAFVERGAKP